MVVAVGVAARIGADIGMAAGVDVEVAPSVDVASVTVGLAVTKVGVEPNT
jgi:hypothetical protein